MTHNNYFVTRREVGEEVDVVGWILDADRRYSLRHYLIGPREGPCLVPRNSWCGPWCPHVTILSSFWCYFLGITRWLEMSFSSYLIMSLPSYFDLGSNCFFDLFQ